MNRHVSLRVLALLLITLLIPQIAAAQRSGSPITIAQIFEAIGAREGSTVCEVGAGDGELSIAAARLVGPEGRIYASELGANRVKALQEKIAKSGFAQITVVAGDDVRTNFPDEGCDALFMRDVYHHFMEPAAMNASISMALKPGGRVAILDFTPPPGSEARCPADRSKDGMHGIRPETLERELKEAGFEPASSDVGGQRWFMIVMSKPKS
jgi:ubiquinone/menaquinone biosynthesis C-methylase UbiE